MRLGECTTFGIGGEVVHYRRVGRPQELVKTAVRARQARLPYFILAGGSNVIGADEHWDGLVIHYFNPRGQAEVVGRIIVAEAGIPLATLIKTAIKNGLAGLESLSGIPGTVGGAIVGNAGAYGQTISDHLTEAEIFDGNKTRWLRKKQCRFQYRESIFKKKDWLVLRLRFVLDRGSPRRLTAVAREIVRLRLKKYRPGLRSPGSFFKNVLAKDVSRKTLRLIPKEKIIAGKIPAGYLLEAVGACGLKTKHLAVASYHGNLIINRGGATCREVKKLAALLKKLVFKKFGIRLEEEVRYM